MSKKKIFLAAGSIVLAIVGFFTASAHRRFAASATAYFNNGTGTYVTLFSGNSNSVLTLVKGTNSKTAFFYTGTSKHTLWANKTHTSGHTLFFTN